jgi:octaprenyl-diphosphate synthase
VNLLSPLDGEKIKSALASFFTIIDQALTQALKSHVPFIEEVANYMVFSEGKRLRPVLFLLITRLLRKPAPTILSAIFEYLHAASLLHDDVVDNAGLRRGLPAARVKYGNPEVILVGDFLFSKSYDLAAAVPDPAFSAAMAKCTTSMAEGQVLELIHTGNLQLDQNTYETIITAKTAELIACACQTAGIYTGSGEKTINALYQYGIKLGMAFQMVDDALDYISTAQEFGKDVGHDLEEGKITMPFIWTRDAAVASEREKLMIIAARAREDNAARQLAENMVIAAGGVQATLAEARSKAIEAQQTLLNLNLPQGPDLDLLLSLASYVVTRRQ